MLEDPLLDPMGSLIAELRADSDVAALVSTRVRGFEPAPGDAQGPGSYAAFIVVRQQAGVPHSRVPIQDNEYLVQCYGVTAQGAWAVYGAVVKAVHAVGVRVKANGLGIYRSWVIQGGDQVKDPDTQQPYVEGTIRLIATAQAVTV